MSSDTIYALSSGAPPAAIAVMRVSGPAAGDALIALAGRLPTPRRATLQSLRSPDGDLLDQAVVLWLPGPATATGEDLMELHLHGGRATILAVETELRSLGMRLARGGEFTRRALEHGRIDLAQAEGLADLLAAETQVERKIALATSEGALSRALHGWYDRLTGLAALVEAQLDHADEEDVSSEPSVVADYLESLLREITEVLERPTVERLRNGPTVVLAGPPNAGKSSLLNALVERDAAIVTPLAGTTRDVLDCSVVRRGRAFRIIDTAGLTDTADPVEQIGVERAIAVRAEADLTLWLGDEPPQGRAMWINARCDLPGRDSRDGTALNVSVREPATVAALWQEIEEELAYSEAPPFSLSDRQRTNVDRVRYELGAATESEDDLVVAEHLRAALARIDELLGRYAPEEMLSALFSRFCIGK